jgi:hypothetical protein
VGPSQSVFFLNRSMKAFQSRHFKSRTLNHGVTANLPNVRINTIGMGCFLSTPVVRYSSDDGRKALEGMDSIRPYENLSNMDSGGIFSVTVEQSKRTDKLTDKVSIYRN